MARYYAGQSVSSHQAEKRRRPVLSSGPGHCPGLHHGDGQYRRGGRRPVSGRSGGSLLDVGIRPAGDDDQLRGKAAVCALPAHSSRRRPPGRSYVLSAGWGGLSPAGGLVLSGLSPCHVGWGRDGSVRFHRRLPPRGIWLAVPGHRPGHRRCGGDDPYRRPGPHRPGIPGSGPRHGPALSGRRRAGAAAALAAGAPGSLSDFPLRPHT